MFEATFKRLFEEAWVVLDLLERSGGKMRTSDLRSQAKLGPTPLRYGLERLLGAELIQYRKALGDARGKIVSINPSAISEVAAALAGRRQLLDAR